MTKPKREKLIPMTTKSGDILKELLSEEKSTSSVTDEVSETVQEKLRELIEKRPKMVKGILGGETWYWVKDQNEIITAWEVQEWIDNFVDVVGAECVGKAQLKKLLNLYKHQLGNLNSYERDVEKLTAYEEGQREVIQEVVKELELLVK